MMTTQAPKRRESGSQCCNRAPTRCLHAIQKFTMRSDGTSSFEYALMLMVTVVVITIGAEYLVPSVRHTWDHVSFEAAPARREQVATATTDNESPAVASPASKFVEYWSELETPYLSRLGWLTLAAIACGALVYLLRRQRESALARGLAAGEIPQSDSSIPEETRRCIYEKRQAIHRVLRNDHDALFESRLEIRHFMSRQLVTVTPKASRIEVEEVMRENGVRHLLVVRYTGQLEGIISNRDLGRLDADTAGEIMTPSPTTVEPGALVSPAVSIMINQHISCLPVVSNGKPCGLLTSTDLLLLLQGTLQTIGSIALTVNAEPTLWDEDVPDTSDTDTATVANIC